MKFNQIRKIAVCAALTAAVAFAAVGCGNSKTESKAASVAESTASVSAASSAVSSAASEAVTAEESTAAAAESAVESVAESTVDSVVESAAEQTALVYVESVLESVSESAVESAAESAAESTLTDVESVMEPMIGGVLGEGETEFFFNVTDAEGVETPFTIHTDAKTVGEALLAVNLIAGEDSQYGLYVKTVNGLTVDYDRDGKYWAFYVDGEYAQAGVDATEVKAGSTYAFKVE